MKTSFPHICLRSGLIGTLALSMCLLAGCGGGSKKSGKVSGKVSYGGEPLGGGTVYFLAADDKGQSIPAAINPQGTYEFTDLAPGEYLVGVETETVKQFAGGKPPPGIKATDNMVKYVPIPIPYKDPKTSGLPKITVELGKNPPKDIDLPKK